MIGTGKSAGADTECEKTAAESGAVEPAVIIGKLIPAGTGLPEVREDLIHREQELDQELAAEAEAAANQ